MVHIKYKLAKSMLENMKEKYNYYPQACTGTTLSSFFRLLIKVILALYTSYASGIRFFTSNPFFGAGNGFLFGSSFIFFILSLAARRSSTMGTGKGFFSFFEYCRGKSAFCGTSFLHGTLVLLPLCC